MNKRATPQLQERRRWLRQGGAAALLACAGRAVAAPRRIGLLGMTSATGYAARWDAFRKGLSAAGWNDGREVELIARFADGQLDRLPAQAAELVAARVEVLVTHGIPGGRAARSATQTVPIVLAAVADPVAAGLVASYARPGGNVTGTAFLAHELAAKRMQLLREALPRATRVTVLTNPRNPLFSQAMFDAMGTVAAPLGLTLQRHDVPDPARFAAAFDEIAERRPDALAVIEEAMFNAHVGPLAELALRQRLPAVGTKDFCDAGGLVGYGADFNAMFERAAHVVDRLLRGARAGELPIEQPMRFEMAANLRTARALGIEVPADLLLRADVVVR
jgi:putative tryptophan/tyrosine transport system substrate-binding protein